MSYNVVDRNPILECLVDQMDHDEQRSGGKLTGLALRDEIINALTQNTIEWPQQSNRIITKEEWIRLMKKDPLFYKYHSRNAKEFEDHEAVLLDLASKYLKRRITLIPFLEGDQMRSFLPNDFDSRSSEASKTSSFVPRKSPWASFKSFFSRKSEASEASSYHLLSCNKVYSYNFYISIFFK